MIGRLVRLAVAASLAFFAGPVSAQKPGSPVVADGQGSTTPTYSNAYIDASASSLAGTDFCTTLNNALQQLAGYAGGAGVIDARGVSIATACSNTATGNPWNGISVHATVLLPAGTIMTKTSWILPSGTKLVGEGGEDPGLSFTSTGRTIIQAQSGFSGIPIIQMGVSLGCTAVSIEELVIDGQSMGTLDGIDNTYCGDQSYVSHVTLYRIVNVGLNITSNVPSAPQTNSGPYTNITFDTAGSTATTNTYGASFNVTTRGFQGITCTTGSYDLTSNTSDGTCINIAGPGNSVQDVRIEGFSTGILVAASNTVVMNVDGDTNPHSQQTTLNVVNIGGLALENVALIGIANNCVVGDNNTQYCQTGSSTLDNSDLTISDNLTGTRLHVSTDPFVAMYVVGTPVGTGTGVAATYSKYTTSQSTVNWAVGNVAPSGNTCSPGSLYSNVSGNPYALYVCSAVTGSKKTWHGVQ